MSDETPEHRLYETIADREGWAWRDGRALHVSTGREVSVEAAGSATSPYLVVLADGEQPWRHHDPATAVRQVEQHGEPRYTLAEARRIERSLRCAEEGHRLRVQVAADGSPSSVRCANCPGWWAVQQEHVDAVLDALVMALRFVSPDELPMVPGHLWFDVVAHYRPGQADELVREAETKARAVAAMTGGHPSLRPLRAVPTTPEPDECYECETNGVNCLAHRRPPADAPTDVLDPQLVSAQRSLALVRTGDAPPGAAG